MLSQAPIRNLEISIKKPYSPPPAHQISSLQHDHHLQHTGSVHRLHV